MTQPTQHVHYEKDIITTGGAQQNLVGTNTVGLGATTGVHSGVATETASRDVKTMHTHSNEVHTHGTHNATGLGAPGAFVQGEVIVEKIYEKPVVISHQEKAVFKESYEGKTVERHELATDVRVEIAKPIVKEIHQDVIHEHHKDVVVEHKKDILHEHHQQVIHEHHQPVIIEKHLHEHHQPIIHEKHQTLIEEKHVPIIHEAHTHTTDKERKDVQVTEVFEKAIVDKHVEKPIVTETVEQTIVQTDKSAHLAGSAHAHTHTTGVVGATGAPHTTEYTKEEVTVKDGAHAHGETRVHETLKEDGQLLEDEEWIVDEKGGRRKQKKAGFFSHLKEKITGHHHH